MPSTKEKIVNAAQSLFDKYGMANVRLLQIADAVGISVGNLTYHFKTKEHIVDAVMAIPLSDLREILKHFRSYPNLLDWNHQLTLLVKFSEDYPHFYRDYIEVKKSWPKSSLLFNPPFKKILLQTQNRFEYNVERGVMHPERYEGHYDILAQTITQLIIGLSLSDQILSLKSSAQNTALPIQVWNIILPLLTEEGMSEYTYVIEPLLADR